MSEAPVKNVDWMELINRHHEVLEELVDPDFGLVEILLSSGTLSRRQHMQIKHQNNYHERNVRLLKYITESQKPEEFINALSDSNQRHIVNYLLSNGEYQCQFGVNWPLTNRQMQILDINYSCLVELLDTFDLLPRLYSCQVINRRQLAYISSKPTSYERNEAFFGILRQRSFGDYNQTIKCLNESCQNHIANILEEGGVFVRLHANLLHGKEAVEDDIVELLKQKPGENFSKTCAEIANTQQSSQYRDKEKIASTKDEHTQTEFLGQTDSGLACPSLIKPPETSELESTAVVSTTGTQTDLQLMDRKVSICDTQCQTECNLNCCPESLWSHSPVATSNFGGLNTDFEYKEALNKCAAWLLDCLDVRHGLLDYLVAKRVLTKRQEETVEAQRIEHKQINELIDLIHRGGVDHFKIFLETLSETNQEHVANMIISYGDVQKMAATVIRPLGKTELEVLDKYRTKLIDCIDPDLILNQLLEANCITFKHMKSIKESTCKSNVLVDIIRRGSIESLNHFKEILSMTHTNGISEVFQPLPDPNKIQNLKPINNRIQEVEVLMEKLELMTQENDLMKQEKVLMKQERDMIKQERNLLKVQLKANRSNRISRH